MSEIPGSFFINKSYKCSDSKAKVTYEDKVLDWRPQKEEPIIDINIDILEPDKTVEKRSGDDINIDTLGEISRKRAEKDENSIELPDIRYEDDMSAGTAG